MRQSSWGCTIFIQLSLCLAIYVSLHLGRSFFFSSDREAGTDNGRHLDLHFITVAGGFRPLHRQHHLLQLMGSVAKSYNVRFLVSTSELGDKDPLFRNATLVSSSLKLPWFTTGASREKGSGYFTNRIELPLGGTLDIIFMGNGPSQQDTANSVPFGSGIAQLNELTKTLKAANADWRIVVGSDPSIINKQGKEPKESKQVDRMFHQILTNNGVNIYMSNSCNSGANQDSVACIAVPSPTENRHSSNTKREMEDGLLLHRVSFSNFVTSFITLSGQVMDTRIVKQKGREVM